MDRDEGQTLHMILPDDATVSELKDNLIENTIKPRECILLYNEKDASLLPDDLKLSSLQSEERDPIKVIFKEKTAWIKVKLVEYPEASYQYIIFDDNDDKEYTIKDLKKKIQEITGLETYEQILGFNQHDLIPDDHNLYELFQTEITLDRKLVFPSWVWH